MQAHETLGGLLVVASRLLSNKIQLDMQERIKRSDYAYEEKGNPFNFTTEQMMLLVELDAEDALMPSEIATRMMKTKATITSLIIGAEGRGLVTRERDDHNKKIRKVCLTEFGTKVHAELLPVGMELVDYFSDKS